MDYILANGRIGGFACLNMPVLRGSPGIIKKSKFVKTQMMQARPAFNEVELSFLELSKGRKLTTEDAVALKTLWARYFLDKATHAADAAWKKKKYSRETMNKLVKGAK